MLKVITLSNVALSQNNVEWINVKPDVLSLIHEPRSETLNNDQPETSHLESANEFVIYRRRTHIESIVALKTSGHQWRVNSWYNLSELFKV